MNIKEAEVATGVSKRNIRYYEQVGLIHPARNTENDYREYSQSDLETLKLIRGLRMIDMPLEQVKQVLQNKTTLQEAAVAHKQTLLAQKKRIELAISFCDDFGSVHTSEDVDEVLLKMDQPQNRKALYKKWFDDHRSDLGWGVICLVGGSVIQGLLHLLGYAAPYFIFAALRMFDAEQEIARTAMTVTVIVVYGIILLIWSRFGFFIGRQWYYAPGTVLCNLMLTVGTVMSCVMGLLPFLRSIGSSIVLNVILAFPIGCVNLLGIYNRDSEVLILQLVIMILVFLFGGIRGERKYQKEINSAE